MKIAATAILKSKIANTIIAPIKKNTSPPTLSLSLSLLKYFHTLLTKGILFPISILKYSNYNETISIKTRISKAIFSLNIFVAKK